MNLEETQTTGATDTTPECPPLPVDPSVAGAIDYRFCLRAMDDEQRIRCERIAQSAHQFATVIAQNTINPLGNSAVEIAIERLDECLMWAKTAVLRG